MELKPGFKQTEVGGIPQDWEVKPMAELFTFQNGVNAEKSAYGRGVPFINVLEVITHCTITKPRVPGRISLSAKAISAFAVQHGDVLFNRTSETQEEVGLASVYTGTEVVVFGGFVIRARPRDHRMDSGFAAYALRSPIVRSQIVARGQGAVRANIGQHDLARVLVVLPTKAEQEAIAEALSDADALIESLEQLVVKKRQLKQGAMQELLTGKKRLPGFSGEWEVRRLGDESELITKGTTPTSLGRKFTKHGINFVKVESLADDGTVLPEMLAAVDEGTHQLLKRSQLREDDILFSIAGALGRTAIVNADLLPANTNQALAIIRLKRQSCLRHGFVLKYLSGPQISTHIAAINVQAAQANLSLEDIRSFEVQAPSAAEQTAIAGILSDMDAEIAALETKLAKARHIKQGMMQELLTGRIRLV